MINRKSFLVTSFEAYHQIIFKYRKKIKESIFFDPSDNSDQKIKKIYELQNEISNFIKTKSAEIIAEAGKIGGDIFEEVGYIMASLADEVFIVLNWDGKDFWKNNLIEQKLFSSNVSGEMIFERINSVLRDNSVESYELALIYFYCLSLGFQGALRSMEGCVEVISNLKAKLYYKIYFKDSQMFKQKGLLCPSAYKHLFAEKKLLFDNPLIFWRRVVIASIICYFVYVEFVWNYNMKFFFSLLGRFVGG